MSRYIVTAVFSVWADDEHDALKQAIEWQETEARLNDNRPAVMKIEYAPTGRLARPQVYPENHLEPLKQKQ